MTRKITDMLDDLGACEESLDWLKEKKPSNVYQAWRSCPRGDWLLWFAAKIGVDRRLVVAAACEIARDALPIFEGKYPDDNRPRKAIETAEEWCKGKATQEQVRMAAAAAAAAAADAAAAAAAADAADAWAAAWAAAADAWAAAWAAADAADAADAAADAAAADARDKALQKYAAIVRKHISWRMVKERMK